LTKNSSIEVECYFYRNQNASHKTNYCKDLRVGSGEDAIQILFY